MKISSTKPSKRPAQGTELDHLRARAFAAEGGVGAARQKSALEVERDHGDEHEHQRERGREPVFRRIVEQRVDPGRQGEDAAGKPDDRLRAEQGERIDEGEQRAGQDGGRHQRRRDGKRGAQLAGAENLRRLLVGGVDRHQRARRQQIDEGESVEHGHQHQPGHREDVEGQPGKPGDVAHEYVDQPGIGAEQIGERDRGEKRRRQIGERCGELDQRLARHVGAAHRPGQHDPDDQAEQSGPGAEDERVLERSDIEPAGEHLAEMIEREPVLAFHAAEQQRDERKHHQHDQRDHGRAHHHMFEPQPPAQAPALKAGRQRGGIGGHRIVPSLRASSGRVGKGAVNNPGPRHAKFIAPCPRDDRRARRQRDAWARRTQNACAFLPTLRLSRSMRKLELARRARPTPRRAD